MFSFRRETLKSLVDYTLRGGEGKANITRFAMYKKLGGALSQHGSPEKSCLAISHSSKLYRVLGLQDAQYTAAHYPEADVLSLPFPDESFDFCISDQVFEHIAGNPFKAFAETARVLKPGGFLCHTTCFVNPVHARPDFWRFTPGALELMAAECPVEVIAADGWGNREAWAIIHAGHRGTPIPDDPLHPLYSIATKNEENWPIVTWIIAQKNTSSLNQVLHE